MTFRRSISLYRVINGETVRTDQFAEIIGCIVSLLFLAGVIYLSKLILAALQADKVLIENENKFRTIFEQANDGIMIADPVQKRNTEANRTICKMLGYTRDELITLRIEDTHPKEDLPWILDIFERQVRGEMSLASDVPMLRKDGSVIYVDVNSTLVALGGNKCLIGIFRDTTERKLAAEALQTHAKQLAESQRIAHIGSWQHNLTTGQVFWSDELFRLFGLDPKTDIVDFNMFFDMVHPDDKHVLKAAIDETVRLQSPLNIDFRFILENGSTRIFHAQAELIHDDTGTQAILSGTSQDITESKLAEEKIQLSEQFIHSILDTVDEGFIVIDRDFRIVTANAAYCRQYGVAGDEAIGRHCYEISHKSLRPCFEEGEDCGVRHVFETGESYNTTHRHPDAKGEVLYVETKVFPIKDSSGAVTSVIETVNNITEKHLLEEERLKTQKLEAIGMLAGGIAHDFNNLLQGVFGYISMAKIANDDRKRSHAMLEQAEKALNMSVDLTNQLLTFSKGGKPLKKRISLQPVIENSVRFALSGSSIDYRIKLDDDLWHVEADAGQLGQVIQNIVLNADQSMPIGGTILITAKNIRAPKKGIPKVLEQGMYVEVSIQDNGVGISEEYLPKIFDPYFTTKAKGSGLGLATCYSIVKNHGGVIHVSSKVGKGTTFYVYFPAVEADEEVTKEPESSPFVHEGRILLMDDEEMIRDIAGEMIKTLDHEIELAICGEEAIEKYKAAMKSGNPFDIVILDLTIRGGLGGRETIEQLLELNPKIKAIVSSGYSDDAAVSDYHNYGFSARLTKPYKLEELRDTLNNLLS
ncbi:MAG: PAS domain S-box protein [Dissulfurispiraceae bacterium]